MEYYFHDQLRWTYGFENPNKAAALLATLLPFVWLIYASAWKISSRTLRISAIVVSALALGAGWSFLLMTFSRGGLVAAGVATFYIGWKTWSKGDRRRWRTVVSAGLLATVVLGGLATGAVHRSTQWIGKREGSVDNRLALWKGSLEMIAAIPQGVGTGRSGSFYMQWFQPLENTARYRTLVNSFLTFTVEQGLGMALGSCFLVVLFWRGTNASASLCDSAPRNVAICLRASLLAFAVAGFFSTTMEEPVLWIVPILAMVGSIAGKCCSKTRVRWERITVESLLTTALLGSVIMAAGWWWRSPTKIALRQVRDGRVLISVHPRNSSSSEMEVAVDKRVLGGDYGKLLRRLAEARNLRLLVGSGTSQRAGRKLVVGNKVAGLLEPEGHDLILVMPEAIDNGLAKTILAEAKTVRIFLSSYDEDGRGAFWTERAAQAPPGKVQIVTLEGVGTQIGWAWGAVIDRIQ